MSDAETNSTSTADSTDAKDLGEKAALLVSAIVLTISSILVIYQLFKYYKHLVYKPAQYPLMILFLMPTCIGWTSLASLSTGHSIKILEFLLNVYKSVGLICFMVYIDRMMGWTKEGDQSK